MRQRFQKAAEEKRQKEAAEAEQEREKQKWMINGKKITPSKLQTMVNQSSTRKQKAVVKAYDIMIQAPNHARGGS